MVLITDHITVHIDMVITQVIIVHTEHQDITLVQGLLQEQLLQLERHVL